MFICLFVCLNVYLFFLWLNVCLFVYLFVCLFVIRPAREYFAYNYMYGDVTIVGKGLQNLVLCLVFQLDLYRATPVVTRGLGFCGLIRRTFPI